MLLLLMADTVIARLHPSVQDNQAQKVPEFLHARRPRRMVGNRESSRGDKFERTPVRRTEMES